VVEICIKGLKGIKDLKVKITFCNAGSIQINSACQMGLLLSRYLIFKLRISIGID